MAQATELSDPAPDPETSQPPVQVPDEVLKLYYRLRQLGNYLVLIELDEQGLPSSIVPLARLERFATPKIT